jgi:hypothetical protein
MRIAFPKYASLDDLAESVDDLDVEVEQPPRGRPEAAVKDIATKPVLVKRPPKLQTTRDPFRYAIVWISNQTSRVY